MFKNKNKNKDNTKIRTGSFTLKTIPVRENGDNYYYIENFEQANEKQCKEYDKLNQLIFQKYNGIYDKISNKIGNCPFKLDKKPELSVNINPFLNICSKLNPTLIDELKSKVLSLEDIISFLTSSSKVVLDLSPNLGFPNIMNFFLS